jgi:hypothetical protein
MSTLALARSARRLAIPRPVADAVAAVLGAAVTVAIYLDGRAHLLNLPDSFFTWWHGLLYGGVTALAGWLMLLGWTNGARGGRPLRMPAGYGLSLAGAVLFFVGGVADLVWHSILGIEVGLDALLSPSHLWLFVAGALMLSGPVRAARARQASTTEPPGWPAVTAVTSLAGLAAFALSFLSAFYTDGPGRSLPHYPEGTPEHAAVEIPASWGLASFLVTAMVLALPMAYLVLRWRLPFGTVTAYSVAIALLAVTLMDFRRLFLVAATAVAGLGVDAFLSFAAGRGLSRRMSAVVAAGLLPWIAFGGVLIGEATWEHVAWPPALTGGVVALSALLSALGAGFLAGPPMKPPVSR